jgi:hypothetical protein
MRRAIAVMAVLAVSGLLPACTWVKLTPEGTDVRVAQPGDVANCERLGKVNVSLKSRIAGVERSPTKVDTELQTLARNEGAVMGGDTVVSESQALDGRQQFGVYRCRQ